MTSLDVDASAVIAQGSRIESVSKSLSQAVEASDIASVDDGAFGILCNWVPSLFSEALHSAQDGLKQASAVIDAAASAVSAAGKGYQQIEEEIKAAIEKFERALCCGPGNDINIIVIPGGDTSDGQTQPGPTVPEAPTVSGGSGGGGAGGGGSIPPAPELSKDEFAPPTINVEQENSNENTIGVPAPPVEPPIPEPPTLDPEDPWAGSGFEWDPDAVRGFGPDGVWHGPGGFGPDGEWYGPGGFGPDGVWHGPGAEGLDGEWYGPGGVGADGMWHGDGGFGPDGQWYGPQGIGPDGEWYGPGESDGVGNWLAPSRPDGEGTTAPVAPTEPAMPPRRDMRFQPGEEVFDRLGVHTPDAEQENVR